VRVGAYPFAHARQLATGPVAIDQSRQFATAEALVTAVTTLAAKLYAVVAAPIAQYPRLLPSATVQVAPMAAVAVAPAVAPAP
jgi:Mg/Co/Ni transporter MgtE